MIVAKTGMRYYPRNCAECELKGCDTVIECKLDIYMNIISDGQIKKIIQNKYHKERHKRCPLTVK